MADAEDSLGSPPDTSARAVQEAALVGTEEDVLDLPVMTKRELEKVALEHGGYGTPRLNDTLYLHSKGYRRIENLEAYTGLTSLWLHSNGFGKIEHLNHLQKLRCLFLQANAFTTIEGLDGLTSLVQLDLSENSIQSVAGLSHLPHLATLNLSRNFLKDADGVRHLQECRALTSVDLSKNQLDGADVIGCLAGMAKITSIHMAGNPVVTKVASFRKKVIAACKTLRYLDRPVFDNERAAVEAWARGGIKAEREAQERQRRAKDESERRALAEFRAWQESVRGKVAPSLPSSSDEESFETAKEEISVQSPDTTKSNSTTGEDLLDEPPAIFIHPDLTNSDPRAGEVVLVEPPSEFMEAPLACEPSEDKSKIYDIELQAKKSSNGSIDVVLPSEDHGSLLGEQAKEILRQHEHQKGPTSTEGETSKDLLAEPRSAFKDFDATKSDPKADEEVLVEPSPPFINPDLANSSPRAGEVVLDEPPSEFIEAPLACEPSEDQSKTCDIGLQARGQSNDSTDVALPSEDHGSPLGEQAKEILGQHEHQKGPTPNEGEKKSDEIAKAAAKRISDSLAMVKHANKEHAPQKSSGMITMGWTSAMERRLLALAAQYDYNFDLVAESMEAEHGGSKHIVFNPESCSRRWSFLDLSRESADEQGNNDPLSMKALSYFRNQDSRKSFEEMLVGDEDKENVPLVLPKSLPCMDSASENGDLFLHLRKL